MIYKSSVFNQFKFYIVQDYWF